MFVQDSNDRNDDVDENEHRDIINDDDPSGDKDRFDWNAAATTDDDDDDDDDDNIKD